MVDTIAAELSAFRDQRDHKTEVDVLSSNACLI